MAADELGGGFHNDVGAVLQRAEQVRGGEGVVHDHRQVVLVGDGGDGLEVGQVGVRVAEGLEVDELGVLLDGVLELLRVLGGDEGGGDAVARQGVAQQVEGAAVHVLGCDDVVAGLGDVAHRVFHGGRAGRDGQARGAAFEGRDAVFEHALGGVGQTSVDVARIRQSEAGLGVVEAVEDVAGGLVDRHRAGVGGRVGLLLADVQLQGFETIVLVCHDALSLDKGSLFSSWLATRPAVQGAWPGVGSDNKPAGERNASRTLSHLPISPYKPLESLAFPTPPTVEKTIRNHSTRRSPACR